MHPRCFRPRSIPTSIGPIVLLLLWTAGASANDRNCDVELDADGDGHITVLCGGNDCDDNDADRFPGNPEVCDAEGHDEDCDPYTFGWLDEDSDGFPDARCCNTDGDGNARCGTDCDDFNVAIAPNAQVCNGRNVALCLKGEFQRDACFPGTVCIPQPNGTGLCSVEPPGYVTPATFVQSEKRPLPSLDQALGRDIQRIDPAIQQRLKPTLRVPLKKPKSGG